MVGPAEEGGPGFGGGVSPAQEKDPWKHRSKGMLCATCMYYVPKVANPDQGHAALGRCRRHAPTMSGYPVVFPHDWCGDHKLNENVSV